MMVTKNSQLDKTGQLAGVFKNLTGNSFLVSKTNTLVQRKRKGLAHAFYKDKLTLMLDNLKDYLLVASADWLEKISKSSQKSVTIDMSREIPSTLHKFFTHMMFGKNIDEDKLTILKSNPDDISRE